MFLVAQMTFQLSNNMGTEITIAESDTLCMKLLYSYTLKRTFTALTSIPWLSNLLPLCYSINFTAGSLLKRSQLFSWSRNSTILWNPEVHCYILHKTVPLDPAVS